MRTIWLRWLALAFLLAFMAALPAAAQNKTLYWERFDVDVAINQDGSFDVAETQEIVFTSGTFTFGFRGIDGRLLDSITNVGVEDETGPYVENASEQPGTFTVTQEGADTVVRWYFEPATDETRTFVIRYKVLGGLRYYDGGDHLWWQAVYADRGFPVNNSVVQIHVPAPAEIQNLDTYFTQANIEKIDAQTARFTVNTRIPADQALEVRAQFTHGVVAGAPASWQTAEDERAAQLEAQQAYNERWRPVADTVTGALALLFLVLGPLGLYLLWYWRGRDAPVDLAVDYLPEPPSTMPPGMVGALLDEHADLKDILATLVDLARRGYVKMEEMEPGKPDLSGKGASDFQYTLLKQPDEALKNYEKLLLTEVFGTHDERKLSDLKEKFYARLPKLKATLYEEVAQADLFVANPERTRNRWALYAVLALLGVVAFSCAEFTLLANYTNFAICLPAGPGIFAIGLFFLARFMPRKTAVGAEAATRWKAFRTYLTQIDKYTDLERATELFDRYLPYAIAFGLEKDYIKKWSYVPTAPIPPWYVPYPRPFYGGGYGYPSHQPSGHPAQAAPAPRPAETGGQGGIGGLGDASQRMAGGLAGMSTSLSGMLSSAASTLTSRPAPPPSSGGWTSAGGHGRGGWSGGGWSGGGGFGGGGGGGGRGGFG